MVLVEDIIVGCRCTEVIAEHTVVCSVKNTSIRKDGNRQGIDIVGVCIQIVVVVANSRVAHGTVSLCLVGVVLYVMLACCSGILHGTEGSKLNLCNRLVRQRCLHTEVNYVEVDIVVLQLMEDIERRIVTGVKSIWVESTRRVQRIRIRVDIERAAHLTGYRVCGGTDSTRCLLLTIRGVTNDAGIELLGKLVVGIEIGGISLYGTLVVPSRVVHGTY